MRVFIVVVCLEIQYKDSIYGDEDNGKFLATRDVAHGNDFAGSEYKKDLNLIFF